jgi:hypothetical protein
MPASLLRKEKNSGMTIISGLLVLAQRNPILLLRSFGLLLLRLAHRQLSLLLLKEPPRNAA